MTALSTMSAPTLVKESADLRPLPWRRMAWVTWRQHRTALIGVVALIGALALCLLIVGLQLHHAYAAAIACHPANSTACTATVTRFNSIGNFLSNGLLFLVVPPLIGAFVGAPLLAREFEAGTFRYAWSQGFGRWRWTLAKLVALGVVVAVASGALSVLASWYYRPYFASGNQSLSLSLTTFNPLNPVLFEQHGVAFAAWTLAAFAIGALALDLYYWLAHRLYSVRKPTLVPWALLARQFGSQYAVLRQFKAQVVKQLRVISLAYPQARVNITGDGLLLGPSPLPVAPQMVLDA
jgi:hypothetical protein